MVADSRSENARAGEEGSGSSPLQSSHPAAPVAALPAAEASTGPARSADAALGPLGWLRARLAARTDGLPRLRRPVRPCLPALRRSGLAAWWSAGRGELGLDEFLRERLAGYLAQAGIGPERLPFEFRIEAGRVVTALRADAPGPGDWHAQYVRAHGEGALAMEVQRVRTEIARAEVAFRQAKERLEPARVELDAASRAASLALTDGEDPGRRGRPAIPFAWSAGLFAFAALLLLADAAHLAVPLLRGLGVRPEEIAAEASRRPLTVALPLVLALGVSTSLFVFAAAATRCARSLLDALPARWHAAQLLAGGASLSMTLALVWAILGGGAVSGRVTSCLIAVALPLATPPLLDLARRLAAARADAVRAARAWDLEHRAAVARWTRASAAFGATEHDCARHEATRAAWAQRFYRLRKRAAEAARLAADAAEAEASELRRMSDAIVGALELDRRAYLDRRPQAPAIASIDAAIASIDAVGAARPRGARPQSAA